MLIRGREREIEQLVRDAQSSRFAVVAHQAGRGATTLLAAGVAASLRAAGAIPVYYAAWQGRNFSTQLKEAVAEAVREHDDRFFAQAESLEEVVTRAHNQTGRRVVLLLDQFEEYLRFHTGTDISDEFDAELGQATNSRYGHVVVALQDHSLTAFDRLSHLIPNLMGHCLRLEPLTQDAAREIVRAMAEEEFVTVDAAVVDSFATAEAATTDGGVHAWLLSEGIRSLLESAAKSKPPAANGAMLEALGGANELILRCRDNEIEKLNLSHKELLFRWCDILIAKDGHRLAATEAALTEHSGRLGRFVQTLLPLLVGNGMLRQVHIGGTARYELSRESLTVILRYWYTKQESAMAARRRAQFRIRSMTIATGSILVLYLIWLYMNWK